MVCQHILFPPSAPSLYDSPSGQKYRVEVLGRRHWAAAALLLNAFDHYSVPTGIKAEKQIKQKDKLPGSGLRDGLEAEEVFLKCILAQDAGKEGVFSVLVTDTGQVHGISRGEERYHCASIMASKREDLWTQNRSCTLTAYFSVHLPVSCSALK
jgi:hypothetical protein